MTKMRLEGHTGPIFSLAFNPVEHVLASGAYLGEIRVWDLDSGRIIEVFQPAKESLYGGNSVTFSPDGSTLAVWPFGASSQFVLWNLHSRQTDAVLEDRYISKAAWIPDGRLLACGETNVTLRDGKTGKLLKELRGHAGPILNLAWSSDGQLLATGGDEDDSSLRIWDIGQGQQIAVYRPTQYAQNVESLAFRGDDAVVYINDSDQPHIWYWRTDLEPQAISHGARIPDADN